MHMSGPVNIKFTRTSYQLSHVYSISFALSIPRFIRPFRPQTQVLRSCRPALPYLLVVTRYVDYVHSR